MQGAAAVACLNALLLCALQVQQRPRDALLRALLARAQKSLGLCLNLVSYGTLAR